MIKVTQNIASFVKHLNFSPTKEQMTALDYIIKFIHSKDNNTFILTGAAGTGKTSILKAVADYLLSEELNPVLLAPTGRAASIISQKTGFPASTIHAHLYRVVEKKDDDGHVMYIEFVKRENHGTKPYIYLIDEASMVGDIPNNQDYFVSKKPLLEDIISYVSEGHPDNKIIFVGDPYQLPPVNSHFSQALSEAYLQTNYHLDTVCFELTEVKRQEENSYILENAIQLREGIQHFEGDVQWRFEKLESEEQTIRQYYQALINEKAGSSIFLAWKNVSIDYLNNKLREMLYGNDKPVVTGERIILNQSNFAGTYLSNGTLLIVEHVLGEIEEIAGFRFATVKLRRLDTGEILPEIYKIDINSLVLDNRYSHQSDYKQLWHGRFKVNKKLRETKDGRTDEYLSALKVRYAYAITTHKAQGGEWDNVYLYPEIPYGTNGLKWLYTTITRAKKHIFSFE